MRFLRRVDSLQAKACQGLLEEHRKSKGSLYIVVARNVQRRNTVCSEDASETAIVLLVPKDVIRQCKRRSTGGAYSTRDTSALPLSIISPAKTITSGRFPTHIRACQLFLKFMSTMNWESAWITTGRSGYECRSGI